SLTPRHPRERGHPGRSEDAKSRAAQTPSETLTSGPLSPWALLAFVAGVAAIRPISRVGSARGRELVAVLVGTGVLQAAFGALLALGLWIDGAVA
ncbi:MAG: hypothetical protein ACXWX9_01330, partial [Actinomycetota bacterium]